MNAVSSGLAVRLRTFWPMLAGIVCARTSLVVTCYGSYAATDDGLFTDGAMLLVCALFVLVLAAIARTRRHLPESAVSTIFIVSVVAATAAALSLTLLGNDGQEALSLAFALSTGCTLALSLCMFYWLRALSDADEITAALFVFSAFIISVVVIYLLSFLPKLAQGIVASILVVAQLAFVGPALAHRAAIAPRPHRRARTFFTFARNHVEDGRFLVVCTVGMGSLSFVDGFLRGYPDGLPIPFTPPTSLACVLLTLIVCGLLVGLVIRRRQRAMTVGVFVIMELLASAALVLFAAFPFQWEIGAVAVNTLNVVICAFCWYVIIAFTRFGERDPYIYAMGGWVACFGMRSVARMLLFNVYPLTGNDLLINSLLGALILISTQVVLVQFLLAEHGESAQQAHDSNVRAQEALRQAAAEGEAALRQAEAEGEEALRRLQEESRLSLQEAERNAARMRETLAQTEQTLQQMTNHLAHLPHEAMGMAARPISAAEVGAAPTAAPNSAPTSPLAEATTPISIEGIPTTDSLEAAVQRMGEQFLLSSREVDVLALYAAGYTQKKVAEELYITPATAHTHIKRIYSKCGLHSRQEILEYLATYGS